MYQVNVVEGPTALSVLVGSVDDPWYLHSIVPLPPEKYIVIIGHRNRKPTEGTQMGEAKPDEWRRW